MGLWAWVQSGEKIWKVVSNYENGTIFVYDDNGAVLLEKKGLTKMAMMMIEHYYLNTVATNLIESKDLKNKDGKKIFDKYNPMYT